MKKLSELLAHLISLTPHQDTAITGLAINSKRVQPGDLFIATRGHTTDGANYIPDAITRGASAIVVDANTTVLLPQTTPGHSIPILRIAHLATATGIIATRFFDAPWQQLKLIAVTGTNGKTSISQMIAACLERVGQSCGVMGTLGYGRYGSLTPSQQTTPDVIQVYQWLADLITQQISHATMEVSSHALDQQRIAGLAFLAGIFTNLTHDHLDYHRTIEEYFNAKRKLFTETQLAHAIINLDDPFGIRLANELAPTVQYPIYGYSCQATTKQNLPANILVIQAQQINCTANGIRALITTPWGRVALHTQLLGLFNLSNVLAVLIALKILGFSLEEASQQIAQLTGVPGRMQTVHVPHQPLVIVDYAHTPDALEKVLLAARIHCFGKLWCIFGCGGDRDKTKRPEMAAIAEQFADQVVVTSDNPRTEDPNAIIADIVRGFSTTDASSIIADRKEAIVFAIQNAKSEDVIVLAGKGHETYQIIGTQYLPFNDVEEALLALKVKSQ